MNFKSTSRSLSLGAAAGFALLGGFGGAGSFAYSAVLSAKAADNSIQGGNGSAVDGDTSAAGFTLAAVGSGNARVGTAGNSAPFGRAYVIPFQLPDLGVVLDPFSSASFTVTQITGTVTAPITFNSDLYGLTGYSPTSAAVVTAQYFQGASDTTNATLLQDNILTPTNATVAANTTVPLTTSTPGSTALQTYLNAQYDLNGAGSYVFLRLSADADSGTTPSNYAFDTADVAANPPVITYTAVPEPATLALAAVAVGGFIARPSRRPR